MNVPNFNVTNKIQIGILFNSLIIENSLSAGGGPVLWRENWSLKIENCFNVCNYQSRPSTDNPYYLCIISQIVCQILVKMIYIFYCQFSRVW